MRGQENKEQRKRRQYKVKHANKRDRERIKKQ